MELRTRLLKLLGFCALAGVLTAGVLFPVAGGVGVVSNQASNTVDSISADLVSTDPPLLTTITDSDGAEIAYLFDQYREIVEPEEISDSMKAAIIAVEDQRFYDHEGVDWQGTIRAAITNQMEGSIAQGGSTLTQQYVKNYLVHVVSNGNPAQQVKAQEQTHARKLREIRVALQLEQHLHKEEILAGYLNVVPFGNQTYGVAAAAQTYFNTTADKLTIAQAAMLAGIVNSPGSLNPGTAPEEALHRRNVVIELMAGQGLISSEAAGKAIGEPLGLAEPLGRPPNDCVGAGPNDGFFCEYVLDYLQKAGFSKDQLRRGGYTIRTTLDQEANDAAKESAMAEVPKDTPGIANVMAVVEPGKESHKVRALVANRDYGLDLDAGQTMYALPSDLTKFGAGSIYKVFTAAAALEMGMGINNELPSPQTYTSMAYINNGDGYTVNNHGDGGYPASMTLQDALAQSPNTSFVMLQERVGLEAAVGMAERLGMREGMAGVNHHGDPIDLESDEEVRNTAQGDYIVDHNMGAFTLGFTPTSVLELANVSATIVSGGMWCPPSPIEEILDRSGNVVPITEAPCEQVVDEKLADGLFVGLGKDHTDGTATTAASEAGWDRPMMGKTGTAQDYFSAGFIGATPQMAGAVLTFNDGREIQGICDSDPPALCGGGGNIFGGRIPARTWFATMTPIHEGLPVMELPPVEPRYLDGGEGEQAPDVIGMKADEARKTLEDAGYGVNEQSVDATEPEGTVVSQSPEGFAPAGETVTISVSNGNPPTEGSESASPTGPPATPSENPAPEPTQEPPATPPPTTGGPAQPPSVVQPTTAPPPTTAPQPGPPGQQPPGQPPEQQPPPTGAPPGGNPSGPP
ncbi:penicillin-binding protein [Actinoalloteichus hymeniacidonis]|uniref:Membrane carboxypeptidase (Penicillin-binding protein) n=1 Tax=Actinoalloteichus hymeniacidonis TaxID=340345 RepID=A0AAC9HL26_9PSEU|nr:penicillin-binding protein [Actinoalloteichus hymeniacidonis]AOS61083.1 membrane carboxypeptidase (penicillin-binding protein) [Actinoalloteichus hymeniacidonis]MBB5910917.1 membrane peptidoglycan carboxypeptidase [Actinoalloteichus hymeniacidonis]